MDATAIAMMMKADQILLKTNLEINFSKCKNNDDKYIQILEVSL